MKACYYTSTTSNGSGSVFPPPPPQPHNPCSLWGGEIITGITVGGVNETLWHLRNFQQNFLPFHFLALCVGWKQMHFTWACVCFWSVKLPISPCLIDRAKATSSVKHLLDLSLTIETAPFCHFIYFILHTCSASSSRSMPETPKAPQGVQTVYLLW